MSGCSLHKVLWIETIFGSLRAHAHHGTQEQDETKGEEGETKQPVPKQLVLHTRRFNPEDVGVFCNLWSLWGPSERVQEQALRFGQDQMVEFLRSPDCQGENIFELRTYGVVYPLELEYMT